MQSVWLEAIRRSGRRTSEAATCARPWESAEIGPVRQRDLEERLRGYSLDKRPENDTDYMSLRPHISIMLRVSLYLCYTLE